MSELSSGRLCRHIRSYLILIHRFPQRSYAACPLQRKLDRLTEDPSVPIRFAVSEPRPVLWRLESSKRAHRQPVPSVQTK